MIFMWTVVYVSQSLESSKKLVDILLMNRIISKLRRASGYGSEGGYEILVPGTELEKAQDLIFENELF